jgi:hypothetical protein
MDATKETKTGSLDDKAGKGLAADNGRALFEATPHRAGRGEALAAQRTLSTPFMPPPRRRQKLENKLPSLDRELAELGLVVAEAQAEAARAELAEAAREARRLEAAERELLKRIGEQFAGLVQLHGELCEVAELKDAIYGEAARSPLWHALTEQDRAQFNKETLPLIEPFPKSITTLIEQLVAVTLDPGRMGYRHHGTRPPGGLVLLEVTVDLREVARQARLSGRVTRR